MTRFLLLALVLGGCGKKSAPPAEGSGSAVEPVVESRCTQVPFADSSPVPEASGAAWLTIGGKPMLGVVSDSGNDGEYALVDPESGETTESGKLPLGHAGEDLEGAASLHGKLVALSSSGWIRVWQHDDAAKAFTLSEDAYGLGPVDLPDKGNDGNHPPKGDGMVCGAMVTNCGRNYEGLCIVDDAHRPAGEHACIGFAAAKADGKLYCLSEEGGKLVAHHDRSIAITRPGALADCAFGDDGSLWAGSNLFDLATVYEVTGWADPATAKVSSLAAIGVGFPETLAVRGDTFYRMSDTGGSPSLMAKYRCKR